MKLIEDWQVKQWKAAEEAMEAIYEATVGTEPFAPGQGVRFICGGHFSAGHAKDCKWKALEKLKEKSND